MTIDDVTQLNKKAQERVNAAIASQYPTKNKASMVEIEEIIKPKFNKYRVAAAADRTMDGIVFDSKKEMERYEVLKYLEKNGEIRGLELQMPILLVEAGYHKLSDIKYNAVYYYADFYYEDVATGTVTVEDVKGFQTPDFVIKKKLLLYKYPMIKFVQLDVFKKRKRKSKYE